MTTPDPLIQPFWQSLEIFVLRDTDLTLTLTDPNTGQPYNLTGLTVNFWRKKSRFVADLTGKQYACTVSSPLSGIATVTLPGADSPIPVQQWYRVDLVSNTETKAVKFGPLIVFAV